MCLGHKQTLIPRAPASRTALKVAENLHFQAMSESVVLTQSRRCQKSMVGVGVGSLAVMELSQRREFRQVLGCLGNTVKG